MNCSLWWRVVEATENLIWWDRYGGIKLMLCRCCIWWKSLLKLFTASYSLHATLWPPTMSQLMGDNFFFDKYGTTFYFWHPINIEVILKRGNKYSNMKKIIHVLGPDLCKQIAIWPTSMTTDCQEEFLGKTSYFIQFEQPYVCKQIKQKNMYTSYPSSFLFHIDIG